MKKTLFIKNAAILTSTGIILRILGIFFKVWLAARVGSEGIGLYHLVFSVYTLVSTFASAGLSVAVTRLVADELVRGSKEGVRRIIRRALSITLIISLLTFLCVLFSSDILATKLLGDSRAASSLSVMSFSLPFMGISSVLKGYFMARRKVQVNSFAVLLEQAIRISLCLYLVEKFSVFGTGGAVAGVLTGDTLAETASCTFMIILFKCDDKKLNIKNDKTYFLGTKELLRISSPITAGRYATSALRTIENILVPKNLAKAGGDYASALSVFGALKGMALPVLFFPSTILNAFSSLLIPEMSSALALKRPSVIKYSVERVLKITWLLGIIFGGIFFFAGERIGILVYRDSDSGFLIKILAPLVPLMYLDSISDGILKGLDQQIFTFRNAVLDSSLRIILIIFIVPKSGIDGFLVIMFFSNLLTCFLNVARLLRVSGVKPKLINDILLPTLSGVGICMCFSSFLKGIQNNIIYTLSFGGLSLCFYIIFLIVFKIVDIHDYI